MNLGKIAIERCQNLVHDAADQNVTGASQEPASQGPRRKTVPFAHPSHASVASRITHATNHIRNGLSGGFFSSL
jgi:hypothetical protein